MPAFLSDCSEHRYAHQAQRAHDATGEHDAAHARERALLQPHIQDTRRERPCPRAGSRQGDTDEQQQRPEQPATGLGLQFLAAALTLFETEREEPADDRLVLAPEEDAPREEIDKRDGEHIAEDGNHKRQPQRQPEQDAVGDRAAQFNERHHRDEKNGQTVFKHRKNPLFVRNTQPLYRKSFALARQRAAKIL